MHELRYLDAIVAGGDSAVLDFDVGGRVGEFALRVGTWTLIPLELAAYFQLEPPGVFSVKKVVHVHHGHAGDVLRGISSPAPLYLITPSEHNCRQRGVGAAGIAD